MEKKIPNKLFFKIGEVCELTETQPYVLRYWESEFAALAPAKNNSGQRIYRRRDIETILRIKALLYEEGFTIAGAKKKLEQEMKEGGGRAETPVTRPLAEGEPRGGSIQEIKNGLKDILDILESNDSHLKEPGKAGD